MIRRLSFIVMISSLVAGCSKSSKSQTIKGIPMLDIVSYGYQTSIEINNERVYQGSNASHSGVIIKGVKVGINKMRIVYEPAENSSLTILKVLVRHLAPGNTTQSELLRWQARDPSGVVALEFDLPSWEK